MCDILVYLLDVMYVPISAISFENKSVSPYCHSVSETTHSSQLLFLLEMIQLINVITFQNFRDTKI